MGEGATSILHSLPETLASSSFVMWFDVSISDRALASMPRPTVGKELCAYCGQIPDKSEEHIGINLISLFSLITGSEGPRIPGP